VIDLQRLTRTLPPLLEGLPQQHADGPAISVLMCLLGESNGSLPLATIAQRTDLSLTSVTTAAERLQNHGILLNDGPDPNGSRFQINPNLCFTGPAPEQSKHTHADLS
jgi:DNA-binding IclR family transcriptional regulator